MEGETATWMKLQLRFQEPCKKRLQRKISSTNFVRWSVFLEWLEWEYQSKLDWNFAALAAEIARGRSRRRLKVGDYLLTFKQRDMVSNPKQKQANSKMFWSAVAMCPKGLPPEVRLATEAHKAARRKEMQS